MKEKLLRALKLAPYPLFYFFCLLVFGYLTFPFDRMKDRILAEIAGQTKGTKGAPTVTIDRLDSYWLTGVSVEGLKVRFPPDESAAKQNAGFGAFGMGASKPEPEKESVISVKEAHARARILNLLIGRVQLDFWASVFGGEVSGSAPAGSSKGDVSLKLEDVKLSEVEPLQTLLGVPIDGRVNGSLSLSPVDGKFSKATGRVDLSVKGLVVSDGKTKIKGLLAIPPAKVEEFALAGEADKGVLKITKLSANGPDLELDGDGKITLKDNWGDSVVDLYIKFRFTDAYRGKDATTKSILGEPGSAVPSLIDTSVPELKRAKRSDGFYGFHVFGKLKKPDFQPSPTDASGSSGGAAGGRKTPGGGAMPSPPFGGGKRGGGVALPLGMSSAAPSRDEDKKEDRKEERKEEKTEERRMAAPAPMAPPPAQSAEPEPAVRTPVMEPQIPAPQPPSVAFPRGESGRGDMPGGPLPTPPPGDQPPPPPPGPETPPPTEPR
jgi:type II secretion system protein N